MAGASPWRYVATKDALREMAGEIGACRQLAVDTESDSMYSYYEKVCLVQLATSDGAWIVDPLALDGDLDVLSPVFADPGIRKVLHGADYDIVCLKRGFDFEFRGLFDTMVAAQHLGREKIGLADLVEEGFGVQLEKKYARTNWGRRPLPEAELDYSYLDVKYLIELSRRMEARLAEAGVREEAELEFLRLEEREPNAREFDPDGYLRLRGSRDLSDLQKAVLRELFLMRDRRARKLDRPPFKVLANDTMVRVSARRPRGPADLRAIKGVTRIVARNLGRQILEAVARGIGRGKPPPPRKKKPRGPRLTPRQHRQVDRLKTWRKERARQRGVPTLVVLPNHSILEAVAARPGDIEALGDLPSVGEKRARLYGKEILRIIAG